MGCDIHAMIEARRPYLGGRGASEYWYNAGDPMIPRNYSLFALLAGVRNYEEIVPITEPRGLPRGYREKDVSHRVSAEASSAFRAWEAADESDAHSTSWVTLDELRQHQDALPDDEDLADLIRRMERVADEFDGDGSRVRLVFFFDS